MLAASNALSVAMVAYLVAQGGNVLQGGRPSDSLLRQVVSLWAWDQFWHDDPLPMRYAPNMEDKIYFWSTAERMFFCSEGLRLAAVYEFSKVGQLREVDSRALPSRGDLMAQCMSAQVEMLDSVVGIAPSVPKLATNEEFSPARIPPQVKGPVRRSHELTATVDVRWPSITEYRNATFTSPGLDGLAREVRRRIQSDQGCQTYATIPKFTQSDPSVFVLLGESDCSEAIIAFERDSTGMWSSWSKITADQEVSRYKRKILGLAAKTVR